MLGLAPRKISEKKIKKIKQNELSENKIKNNLNNFHLDINKEKNEIEIKKENKKKLSKILAKQVFNFIFKLF